MAATIISVLIVPSVAGSFSKGPVDYVNQGVFGPQEVLIPEVDPIPTYEEIDAKIVYYANKWGQSYSEMYRVISCETMGTFDPTIQSTHTYSQAQVDRHPEWRVVAGELERSHGLIQGHLPSHPNITREQFEDVDWSLDWMGKQWSLGHQKWWSCF